MCLHEKKDRKMKVRMAGQRQRQRQRNTYFAQEENFNDKDKKYYVMSLRRKKIVQ